MLLFLRGDFFQNSNCRIAQIEQAFHRGNAFLEPAQAIERNAGFQLGERVKLEQARISGLPQVRPDANGR